MFFDFYSNFSESVRAKSPPSNSNIVAVCELRRSLDMVIAKKIMKSIFTAIFINLTLVGLVSGQVPLVKDDKPLERPVPVRFKTNDEAALMDTIMKIPALNGFEAQKDEDAYEINAKKSDDVAQDSYEKLLIWLEPNCKNQTPSIDLFFLVAVYAKFFGGGGNYDRVRLSANDEQKRTESIKKIIQNIKI